MDVGKVATLYIHGSERAVAGNEMYLTAVLRRPYSVEGVQRAYRRFIDENPAIASKFVEFTWRPFTDEERESRLSIELRELAYLRDPAAVHDAYYPTNERLPFRIVRVGEATLVFCVNHAFANGKGLIAWVSRFFETYANEIGEPLPPREPPAVAPAPSALRRFVAAVVGVWWAFAYLVAFIWRAGKDAAVDTVDLGRPNGEPLCRSGFVVRTLRFSADETTRLSAAARARALTVGQYLAATLTDLFFEAQPDRRRVCISMPLDLRSELPHLPLQAIGNYTGSLVVQVDRSDEGGSQIKRAYRWLARRVPYFLTWLVGATTTESKLFARFAAQATRPNLARAPLENFTFALSNLGRIDDPVLERFVADLSGHTRTQTIFVAVMTLNGRLSLEVSFARDLYPAEAVFGLLDRLPVRLLEAAKARAAEARPAEESLAAA